MIFLIFRFWLGYFLFVAGNQIKQDLGYSVSQEQDTKDSIFSNRQGDNMSEQDILDRKAREFEKFQRIYNIRYYFSDNE